MSLREFFYHRAEHARFRRLKPAERRIVVYSESGQDWHHFAPVIGALMRDSGETVCYVSSDPADPGLHQDNARVLPFCIGRGLRRIVFFQTLQAKLCLMTMIDLHKFELKRSVHPVHYVFMFHSLISTHMADFPDSYDHYDTILCAGPHQMREIRKREEMHQLPAKQLIPHGYHRLEQLMAEQRQPPSIATDADIHVLLAPSWGEHTILNVCGEELVGILLAAGFRVTLRPHYQTRWNTPDAIDRVVRRFSGNPQFRVVEKMGESNSLFESHVMITDWSGAGQDYGMGLAKPVLYIDVPRKARNDVWPELGMEPFEVFVRDKIGAILPPHRLGDAPSVIRSALQDPERFRQDIAMLRSQWVFNLGSSASAGASAIQRIARSA
jgi:YidC/Oxa1 family membrane protein insertase